MEPNMLYVLKQLFYVLNYLFNRLSKSNVDRYFKIINLYHSSFQIGFFHSL